MSGDFQDDLATFIDQEQMYSMEGRRGVENLAVIVRALGYKDPLHYGQFSPKGAIGDLIEFFQDNPGAIEAVINWISEVDSPEWHENIMSELAAVEAPDVEDDDE